MSDIIGVLPAAGLASQVHGFFKDMMPIGVNERDKSQFVVTSSNLIIQMTKYGGASKVKFILNPEKKFIHSYFMQIPEYGAKTSFETDYGPLRGMPNTIDTIYDDLIKFPFVMMGMPDTVIKPDDSFKIVLELLKRKHADLALGLFKVDGRNKGGYVKFDIDNNVTYHVDKTSPDFPSNADNAWAVACWNSKFTEFLHDLVSPDNGGPGITPRVGQNEVYFGDVIDTAIDKSSGLKVVADFVSEKEGFYWDIGAPNKYFQLLKEWYPLQDSARSRREKPNKIFIGHGRSNTWKELKSLLGRLKLPYEEFNRLPPAGKATTQRLHEMLEDTVFAFLVMTGEVQDDQAKFHARENVIHEIGLFQGHLGFERTIVLLEEGCEEFSNIKGLIQIRFPKGNIKAISRDIRDVLKREGILRNSN